MKKAYLLSLVVCLLLIAESRAENFRLVVIPDTQFCSEKWPEVLKSSTQWIAENKDRLNIKYALHVGDMVQTGNKTKEWENFKDSMSPLDGKVPYIMSTGNHDYDGSRGVGPLENFNKHYPLAEMKKLPSFGGNFPEGTANNCYQTFTAGGTDWLILSLTYDPDDATFKWANKVVADNPKRQVIVLTHFYLHQKGRAAVGQRMWEELVSRHENISMVLCGHIIGTAHFEAAGAKGNKVHEMLFDWQSHTEREQNSYIAILEFDPEAGKISIKSYSPMLDKYKTDALNQFELTGVKFMRSQKAVEE